MLSKCTRLITLSFAYVYLSTCMIGDASAEGFLNLDAKLKYDNNLTNAEHSSDIVGDSLVVAAVNGGYYIQLNDFDSLRIQGELSGEAYNTFHGLDNVSLGANLSLKRKWGLGLYKPWSALSVSAARLDYSNSLRDGWLYQAQISAGKRITERWDIWADIALQKRTADNAPEVDPGVSGAVFDLINRIFKLDAVYAFNDKTFLTLGYQLRYGDVVSTTIHESPTHVFDLVTTAVALDPIFGPEAEAYRITGTTQIFGARISTALSTNSVLGFEYQRHITHGNGNINYYNSTPTLTFSYGF